MFSKVIGYFWKGIYKSLSSQTKVFCWVSIFSQGWRPFCSTNKDSFSIFSADGMSLRHLQSAIALEKSCLIRIKLDESNSMSNFLDNGKLNYVKLSLFYKMCPNPFQWVHFWSRCFQMGKAFELCHRTLLVLKAYLRFQNAAGFMHENILLEETFGNCNHGPGPGPRAVLVYQNTMVWQVMKSEHNWILHFLWNILVFVCLEAQLFKGKGTFSLPDSNTSYSLGPCSLLRCWYYSGKGRYVSCSRKELSGLVPSDTMKINFHLDSDLIQSCTTRQCIIDLRRFRLLNLHSTFHLWTVHSFPLCVHAPPHRDVYNIGISSTKMENSLNGKLLCYNNSF